MVYIHLRAYSKPEQCYRFSVSIIFYKFRSSKCIQSVCLIYGLDFHFKYLIVFLVNELLTCSIIDTNNCYLKAYTNLVIKCILVETKKVLMVLRYLPAKIRFREKLGTCILKVFKNQPHFSGTRGCILCA